MRAFAPQSLLLVVPIVASGFSLEAKAQFNGACCTSTGTCVVTSSTNCQSQGGQFQGSGSNCLSQTICDGACCFSDRCTYTNAGQCDAGRGGQFRGAGTTCAATCVGACCRTNGTCQQIDSDSCTSAGGTYHGRGSTCAQFVCGGACCSPTACRITSQEACDSSSFKGLGTTCAGACRGACCLTDGTCEEVDPDTCVGHGGVPHGRDSTCAGTVCAGACCAAEGTCRTSSLAGCTTDEFLGLGTTCGSTNCVGACCHSDLECFEIGTIASCQHAGGEFHGHGTRCASIACFGACCIGNKGCVQTTSGGCNDFAGVYQGEGSICDEECPSKLSTGFTYQGQLRQNGVSYSGPASIRFALWDLPMDGQLIAGPIAVGPVNVENGLFKAVVDFGDGAVNGNSRWLEIAACTQNCGGPASFTLLEPRQPLTATPYALQTRGIVVDQDDQVGIGTKTPGNKLTVVGAVDVSERVGIGTTEPSAMLHLNRPLSGAEIRFQTSWFDLTPPIESNRPPSSATSTGTGNDWTNPGSATVSDDTWASTSFPSRFLNLTGFGFAIPVQAHITRVVVKIENHMVCDCPPCDHCTANGTVSLLSGAAPSPPSNFSFYNTSDHTASVYSFGLWEQNLTPGQVNAADFGLRIRTDHVQATREVCAPPPVGCHTFSCGCTTSVFVDAVNISVYYVELEAIPAEVNWSMGVAEQDPSFRIAPTADLSSPVVSISPEGKVAIGTGDPKGFLLAVNGYAAKSNGGSWSSLSDARLKRNVAPIDAALEHLLSLRGVTFEFTEEGLRTGLALPGRHTGLIAQEVASVFPDWVGETPDGYKFVTESGTTALLVEALRDLRAEKDAEISDLKKRLSQIEALLEHRGTEREGEK